MLPCIVVQCVPRPQQQINYMSGQVLGGVEGGGGRGKVGEGGERHCGGRQLLSASSLFPLPLLQQELRIQTLTLED